MAKKNYVSLPRSIKTLFPEVDYAVDATKSVEVIVEAKDCKEAKKANPTECALAKAAKRELRADAVIIGLSTSYIIKDNKAIRFATPMSVQREIVSFDRNQDFQPGEYYLTPKSPSSKLGENYCRRKDGTHGGNKGARRKIHKSARVRILQKGHSSK